MVLKRFLASFGIGNATVDTVLAQSVLIPGEFLRGTVNIKGGSVDQTIDRILLVLETVAEREHDEHTSHESVRISHHSLMERQHVPAGAMLEIPFEMRVPVDTPLTRAFGYDLRIPMYLKTEVEVAGAVNPSDRDRVEIEPNRAQTRILDAMRNLSLQLFKADLEIGSIRGSRLPFYQELEFRAGPKFAQRIHEVELTFVAREHDMDVILEMDKKTLGWTRLAYGSVDEVRGFTVRYDQLNSQSWEHVIENLLLR